MRALQQLWAGDEHNHVAQHCAPQRQHLAVHVVDDAVAALEARVCALCCAPGLIIAPRAVECCGVFCV